MIRYVLGKERKDSDIEYDGKCIMFWLVDCLGSLHVVCQVVNLSKQLNHFW